jgi:undecaprenyl diphosphate synthase
MRLSRIPRHVGVIPDGNRRWAQARGMARGKGYAFGIEPGLRLLEHCRRRGIEEISIYGFTKENVRRPSDQVEAFRRACVEFGRRAVREAGAALLVVGDTRSPVFPDELRPFAERRSDGAIRVNLLVNYGWQWDLFHAAEHPREGDGARRSGWAKAIGSSAVPRIDLVVRWGGRSRLSGFLPIQCAYADLYWIETLWPDSRLEEFDEALAWYQSQDVTLGG